MSTGEEQKPLSQEKKRNKIKTESTHLGLDFYAGNDVKNSKDQEKKLVFLGRLVFWLQKEWQGKQNRL